MPPGLKMEAQCPSLTRNGSVALVRKPDIFIAPVVVLMELISNLDQGNIGFAATQGYGRGLASVGNQFNIAVSILCCHLHHRRISGSTLRQVRIGFQRTIPTCAIIWGTICQGTGFVPIIRVLVAVRLLLGAAEGCIFPPQACSFELVQARKIVTRITFIWGGAALSAAFEG